MNAYAYLHITHNFKSIEPSTLHLTVNSLAVWFTLHSSVQTVAQPQNGGELSFQKCTSDDINVPQMVGPPTMPC
jgi:hypothetical protein